MISRLAIAALLSAHNEQAFEFSPDSSSSFFTTLKELTSVTVRVVVGRSRLGKSLMVELMAQTYGKIETCHLRVNPSSAAETHGIDAVLLIDESGTSGLLILDTAGSDVMMTAIQTNVLFVLALSIATSVTFFVDGELEEEDIVRLASSVNMTQQILAMEPISQNSLPPQSLTIAYSNNSNTCHFVKRGETASNHTKSRLSTAAGVRCACRIIIQEAFGALGIEGVAVPCVEDAIEGSSIDNTGSGSLPAAEVLSRPGVREALLPTAQALLSINGGSAWNGGALVQRFLQIMIIMSNDGKEIVSRSPSNVDVLHASLLSIEIAKQRASLVTQLNEWDRKHPALQTNDADLQNTMQTSIADAVVHIQTYKTSLGSVQEAVSMVAETQISTMTEAVHREIELVIGRRVTARNEADAAANLAEARVAALARNATCLTTLEATKRNAHATSRRYHSHNGYVVQKGDSNEFKKIFRGRKQICGCGNCGARSRNMPQGECPGRPYHTEPTWEEWSVAAKQNGQWEEELRKLGYDFNV